MRDYPKLNAWVNNSVDEAAESFLESREAEDLLEQIRRVRDRIMTSISSICSRRRAVFVKINNKRAVAVSKVQHSDSWDRYLHVLLKRPPPGRYRTVQRI